MPDFECTLWPDGIPTWLGGNGAEWIHCCVAHDLGGTHTELAQCVAAAGYPRIGMLMFAGLYAFSGLYLLLQRRAPFQRPEGDR